MADAGAEIVGATAQDVFAGATEALYTVMGLEGWPGSVRRGACGTIRARAEDMAGLLVNFLNEILFLLYAEGTLVSRIDFQEARDDTGFALVADYSGEQYSRSVHGVLREIKAVTFFDAEFREEPGGFKARVIFDV